MINVIDNLRKRKECIQLSSSSSSSSSVSSSSKSPTVKAKCRRAVAQSPLAPISVVKKRKVTLNYFCLVNCYSLELKKKGKSSKEKSSSEEEEEEAEEDEEEEEESDS